MGVVQADKVKKIHDETLAYVIGNVRNQLLQRVWQANPLSLGMYTKTYGTVACTSQDSDSNIYYSTLPAKIVEFPDPQSGVRKITQKTAQDVLFIPDYSENLDIWEGTELETISDTIFYCVRNGRVEYKNMDTTISQVRMDIIIPFEVYGDTDQVPMPPGSEANIMNLVKKYMFETPMSDLSNDNNPDLGAVKPQSNE
jgi:hypothetical protein